MQLLSQSASATGPQPSSNAPTSLPCSQSPASSHIPSSVTTSDSQTSSTSPQGAPMKEGFSVPPTNSALGKAEITKTVPTFSPLASARYIESLLDIEYPEGVRNPREDLRGLGAKVGKFRYDRDFLLQFMQICKEKPPNLPPLDILGIEPRNESASSMTRGSTGRHRQPACMMTSTARQSSVGIKISGGFGVKPGVAPGLFPMDQFSTPTSKLNSEEHHLPSIGTPSASGHSVGSNRTRSKRSDKRINANKVALSQQSEGSGFGAPGAVPILKAALEPFAPPEMSANRWIATSTVHKPGAADTESPELVVRKVRALLNKLTIERFDSISDQIIAWVNNSKEDKDGRALIQVTRLVYERAIDEAARSEMYARLCRKMMENISPEVQDGTRNSEGKPIAGGQLFRKHLLSRCQGDFECSLVKKKTAAAADAAKASDDQAVKAANEKKGDESEFYSDKYDAAQRAKRRDLGLVKFVGELFKLQMITERIVHQYVKELLGNVENPEEEEIESLCQLLKAVGQLLDVPKARAHMDVYLTRMKELSKGPDVSPRVRFMLQDVIELRDRKWVARGVAIRPTTISAVHKAAAKERAAAEAQSLQRIAMSRGKSRRSGDQTADSGPGPDGWTTAGGSVARLQPKAGDLSQFGKISKPASMVKGPSSVFTKKDAKRDSLSRTSLDFSMFSMLSQNAEPVVDAVPEPSRPPGENPLKYLGQGGAPEASRRKKLKLLQPRVKACPATGQIPPPTSEVEPEPGVLMSEADVKKKNDEDVKGFFALG